MWIMYARASVPDMAYWPGRRWLAALDAVCWPTALVYVVLNVHQHMGAVRPVLVAVLLLSATQRLSTAILRNHRYRFTTWRWARWLAMLLVVGWVLKIVVG